MHCQGFTNSDALRYFIPFSHRFRSGSFPSLLRLRNHLAQYIQKIARQKCVGGHNYHGYAKVNLAYALDAWFSLNWIILWSRNSGKSPKKYDIAIHTFHMKMPRNLWNLSRGCPLRLSNKIVLTSQNWNFPIAEMKVISSMGSNLVCKYVWKSKRLLLFTKDRKLSGKGMRK